MKNMYKTYIKNYIERNRKLLIMLTLIQFLVLPFLVFNGLQKNSGYSYESFLYIIGGVFCAVGCILSFLVPIYNFKFMMQKRSCDLYYALPMSRKSLFVMQYILGLGCIFIPLSANYLLAVLMFIIKSDLLLFLPVFGAIWLIAVLFISCIYTLYVFLIVRCSNFLDSVVVCAVYTIIPFLILGVFGSFISKNMNEILVSSGGAGEIISFIDIIRMVSLPSYLFVGMTELIQGSINSQFVITAGYFTQFQLGIYWIAVSIGAWYFSSKYFHTRKVEQAEHPSTSFLTYPLLILITAFIMILMVFMMDSNVIIAMITVFILYLLMVFFANRRVELNFKIVGKFVVIVAAVFIFSTVFKNTNGFGRIREVPELSSIQNAEVSFSFHGNDAKGKTLVPKDTKNDSIKEIQLYHVTSKEIDAEDDLSNLISMQEKSVNSTIIMREKEENYIYNGETDEAQESIDFITFGIVYRMKDGRVIYRNYDATEISKDMMEYLNKLIDENYINLYDSKENDVEIIYK